MYMYGDATNPFADDSKELLTLNSKDVKPTDVNKSVAGVRN